MKTPSAPDDVTTPEDFETHLAALVEAAVHNGVDPRGAWEFRARDGEPDFDIEIVELDGEYTD